MAAPAAAMMLSDFGADVIKVERGRTQPARQPGRIRRRAGVRWKMCTRLARAL